MRFGGKRWAGYLLALASAQFTLFLMLGEAMAPGYSMHENAISDLGTIAETKLLFNSSLVLIGLLNILAGYALYLAVPKKGMLVVFILGGMGAMGAGLIPLDNPSGLHSLFALFAFVFLSAEAIVVGRQTDGFLMIASVLAGLVGLVFVIVMILVDGGAIDMDGSIGHGGTERMIAYPPLIWMMVFGGYLIGAPKLKGEKV